MTANVSQLEEIVGDNDSVDLGDLGIDKLLGSGRISKAISITVNHASAKAIEKVEAAGGSVIISDDDGDEWEEE